MNIPKQLCRNYDYKMNSNEIHQLLYEVKLIMTSSVILFDKEMIMIMKNKIFKQKIHLLRKIHCFRA